MDNLCYCPAQETSYSAGKDDNGLLDADSESAPNMRALLANFPFPPLAGGCSNASTIQPCTMLNETKAIKITVCKYRRLPHSITVFAKDER